LNWAASEEEEIEGGVEEEEERTIGLVVLDPTKGLKDMRVRRGRDGNSPDLGRGE
jgi:hypothetical protein